MSHQAVSVALIGRFVAGITREKLTRGLAPHLRPVPPRLVESVDQEQLHAVGPALVLNRLGQEQLVTSHAAHRLNFQLSDPEGKIRDWKSEYSRAPYGKGKILALDVRPIVIPPQVICHGHLFKGN